MRSVTINGNGNSISGAGQFRGLFAYAGSSVISNLTITNARAKGGNGGNAYGPGGGGAGLGGALFVGSTAAVTLNNVHFIANSAVGGGGGGAPRGGTLAAPRAGGGRRGGGGGGGL